MMTLRLQLKATTNIPIEVEGVTPDAVEGLSTQEVARLPVFLGNRQHELGELFDLAGDAADGVLRWTGDLAGVHWIGAKMAAGEMHVEGNAGRHLGSDMTGGVIHVAGDAGDWVGGEMHGGLIHVRGRAGHLVGAAYRGSRRGMTGGTILVGGAAGNEVGHTMRRGLIAVCGETGDLAGFNMLAGTILLLGKSGIRHGAGMKRGTIAFFDEPPPLLPTFRRACRYRPEFLRLVFSFLARHTFKVPAGLADAEMQLFNGDMIEGGRGEILVR